MAEEKVDIIEEESVEVLEDVEENAAVEAEEVFEKAEVNSPVLPWQFSTLGMILGVILGVVPFVLSLVGNYQLKKGYNVDELKKAYNIILIISAVVIGLIIIFYIGLLAIGIGSAFSNAGNMYY